MKKLIVLAMIMAVTVLVAIPVHAQTPANDLKPTFINPTPTPGLFVNGWPPFTVSYPKEWGEIPLAPGAVLEVAGTRPGLSPSPVLTVIVYTTVFPLEDCWAKWFMPIFVQIFTDIKALSDNPFQLKDGTPAREIEFEFVPKFDLQQMSMKDAPKCNGLLLVTKRDLGTWVVIMLTDLGKLGEDLKSIASSLTFQPDREKPVQVPPDVRAFFDMWCTDAVSHDLKTVMAHFSDRFRHSAQNKPFIEQFWRNDPFSPIRQSLISCEATVTVFEPRGDKAYVDGFFLVKAKGDANALKLPMEFQQIVNEHGEWKWLGNQK